MLVQASEGNLTLLQRCKDSKSAADVTASSVSEENPADWSSASTYKSLECNERIAQEGYADVMTGSPASSKHLQVPQNAITQLTLQVTHPIKACGCMSGARQHEHPCECYKLLSCFLGAPLGGSCMTSTAHAGQGVPDRAGPTSASQE